MTDFLVFSNEQDAKSALESIYSNMVEAINSPDLLNVATGEVVPKEDLTPDQAVQINAEQRHYPIFGVNAASQTKDTDSGYTVEWAEARETVEETWVYPKPDDSLLVGVSGYTVEPYDPSWFPTTNV